MRSMSKNNPVKCELNFLLYRIFKNIANNLKCFKWPSDVKEVINDLGIIEN